MGFTAQYQISFNYQSQFTLTANEEINEVHIRRNM